MRKYQKLKLAKKQSHNILTLVVICGQHNIEVRVLGENLSLNMGHLNHLNA